MREWWDEIRERWHDERRGVRDKILDLLANTWHGSKILQMLFSVFSDWGFKIYKEPPLHLKFWRWDNEIRVRRDRIVEREERD